MKLMRCILITLATMVFFVPPVMGKNITLTGLVFMEYFYEQPNYGESPETDHIQAACLLKRDNPDNSDNKLNKIHLLLPKTVTCSQMIGHRVEVTGILSETITGHHHGDALLEVATMKQLR